MSRAATSRRPTPIRARWLRPAAAALALALPATAAAAEAEAGEAVAAAPAPAPAPSGLRVGLRSGVAVPLGDAFNGSGALSDTITGYVPLRLDVGYRFARHFYVGVTGQVGLVLPKACPSGGSCSGTDTRVGAMVAYHLLPTRTFDPWIGVGVGYETLSVTRTLGATKLALTTKGLELFDLELGCDVRPGGGLRLGPVLSSSVGRYTRVALNGTSTTDFDTTLHAWVMLGVRGAYDW